MPIQYDSNGIIIQNLTEILDEREAVLRPSLGEDFIIDKTTPIGNIELADANSELAIQELIGWLIPNMIDANTATGYFLDCICEKNRIYRKQPEYTKLKLIIKGTPNTDFYENDITVSDSISGIYYNLVEDCTISEDGTVLANFQCEIFGENYLLPTSELEILTPLVGLDEVVFDGEKSELVLGRDMETDEELRERRMFSVQQTSTNTLGSIRAGIYSLDGVSHATYFENDTEGELYGIPMKSFEFIVDGGNDNDIANVIFNNKAGGTRAYGTTVITVKDSEGIEHTIGFTKAEKINIGIDIKLNTETQQGETWKDEVKKSLKEKFDTIQGIGNVVKDYNYYTVLTDFPEINDIYSIQFFNADEIGEIHYYTQYIIGSKSIAKLDTSNIHITIGQD